MIVGEAPGFTEVAEGRPFVGKSGKLLDNALTILGLRREHIYVTNVVKDMPLNSEGKIRRPLPAEINGWATLLAIEISEIKPVAILALGRTAVDHLMGFDAPFGEKIGTIYSAWHPSYVLRGMDLDHGLYVEWIDQLRPWAEEVGA